MPVAFDPWPIGEDTVEFPNGVRIRGLGLRHDRPHGLDPTLGVYLLGRRPPAMLWPTVWIKWPDMRLPSDPAAARSELKKVLALAGSSRVEIACRGGRGRTGTALAVLAVESGIPPANAVGWVRDHYHPRAVETPWQRRWIEKLVP